MATEQIAVRVPRELLAELDALVAKGAYGNRAEAVRAGLEAIIAMELSRETDRAIVEGYRRFPPDSDRRGVAVASLREAIVEEPW